jgi:hypothetical protein
MDEYHYSSLSYATAIRVLVLRISKDAEHPSNLYLLFSLKEANLQEDSKYEALSYTWGETTYYDGFTYQWDSGPPRTYPIEIHVSGLLQIPQILANSCNTWPRVHLMAPLPGGYGRTRYALTKRI